MLHVVGPVLVDGVTVDVESTSRKTVDDGVEVAVGNSPEMASPARGISSLVCFQ